MDAQELAGAAIRWGAIKEITENQVNDLRLKADSLAQRKLDIEGAVLRIQQVARDTQGQLRVRLENIVQTALDVVFPDSYTFKVEFVPRRGRTEVDMWLDKDGTRMDPLDSNGGGVVDVISLALRVCCLTLSSYDRVLLLDEPFPRIRGLARQRLGELVTMISRELGIQVICVADVAGTSIIPDRQFVVSMDRARRSHVKAEEPEATEV